MHFASVFSAHMARNLYVVAGEHSGDAHGAGLLEALLEMVPDLRIAGAGGPKMRFFAGETLTDWVEDAAVMGIWEVLKHYGWFRKRFDAMLAEICELKPEVLLLIDYPGFNLRFAKAVREKLPETKIVYYISPQVWAWNRGRIPGMARCLDEMMCLFPFEVDIFSPAGLRTTYVGHPLVDELATEKENVAREPNLVGLFPGSREREVNRLLPPMLDAVALMMQRGKAVRFEVPAASERLAALIRTMVKDHAMEQHIVVTDGGSHSLMQKAACGVVASGTATLEAAYFGLPYGLVYKVAWPTYWLGRMLIKVPFIGLVNIIAGRKVVQEWIQSEASAQTISSALIGWLEHPEQAAELSTELQKIAAMLGEAGAHARAAGVVAEWLQGARTETLFKKN
jgi:lipid-A-disaccharide synthase